MAEIEELDSELFPLGSTPLHIVANSGDIKSVKLLLESSTSKSQIDVLDRHGRTPLAVALQNGRFDAAQVLIESGASLPLGFCDTPVSEALLATVPYCTFLEMLIEANVFVSLSPSLLAHLAHAAAYDGRATFLLKLLGSYEIDIDSKDNLGQSSLHYASRRNNEDCVETLLRYGANVMVTNPQGSTALHLACIGGYLNVIPLLLQDWVVPDIAQLLNAQDLQGCTPLHNALYYKKLEVCEYIILNYGSYLDLDLFDNTGYTTPTLLFMLKICSRFAPEYQLITYVLSAEEASWLLFQGVVQGDLELVSRSITSGAIVECMDYMQQTPLLLAAKLDGFEVLRALLAAGADPNATDQGRKAPLHYAYELGRLDIATHLLSLEHLDLVVFFNEYSGPLTTELLVPLIDHMSSHPSRRPKNWRKWLTLVARNGNIPVSVFSQLVSVICPYDWVEHLPSQQPIVESKETAQPVQQVLPILVDGKSKDKHSVQTYQKLWSQRVPLKERRQAAKKIGGAFSCMRQRIIPKIFASYTPKHSVGPTGKTAPDKPFQFHFKRNAMMTFCPIHEAAYHGNTNVLEYLLMNARESSQSLLKQLVVEVTDSSGLTVAEVLAQYYSACREVIIKLNIGELVMNAVSDIWPLQFNYMESLLHYIVSGGSSHSVGQKRSKTPLDKWPQWVFEYMKCYHEDAGKLELDEDGKLCLQTLIKRVEIMTITEENGYPPLVFAAVKSGNELAVRLLLENGAAPNAKFRGRYAITQAAISCKTTIINHFLLTDGSTLLSSIVDIKEFIHDLYLGLCSLANSELVEAAERVITYVDLFPNSCHLWQSSRSLHLLFVLVESKSRASLELSDTLAFDLASFLIKSKLPQTILGGDSVYDAHHATNLMKRVESYSHSFCKCDSSNVRLLYKLAKFYNSLVSSDHQYAFHYLCGLGEFGLVSHFLSCLDSSHHAELFRYMNNHQQSPLYYAASGGHLDIVELLLEKGCQRYYSSENPPVKGALAYLIHSVPYYYSHHIQFHHIHKCYRNQISKKVATSPAFVHCSAYTCSSIVSMVELVDSLLPTAEDLQEILSSEVHTSDIISLLAFQRNLRAAHPLLLLFSDYLEQVNTSFPSVSSDSIEKALNLVQCYAPLYSSESFNLLDSVLADLSTFTVPHLSTIVTAAQKGLWKLVRKALKSPLELPNYSMTTKKLSHIVVAAAREEEFDIVALVHSTYLHERKIPHKCYRPLLLAYLHGQLQISSFIEPQHGPGYLEEAVKLNIASIVEDVFSFLLSTNPSVMKDFDCLIRCCSSSKCLAVLYKYFMEPLVPLELTTEDRNHEFWFKVLVLQSAKGTTELALEAVSAISDTQLRSFSQRSEFKTVLGNCCYWGLKDILECLPFEAYQLLEPCSHSEPLSPWEIAMAMSHIGKLSQIENFPSCSKALGSVSCDSQLHILCFSSDYNPEKMLASNRSCLLCIAPYFFQGVFHRLLSSSVDGNVSTAESKDFLIDFREQFYLDLFENAIKRGSFHFVRICLEHFGGYAGELLDMLSDELRHFIQSCCERRDNVEILELFLSHLHNADRLNKYLDVTSQRSLLSVVVSMGSVSCAKILVRWLSSDMLDDQLHCQYHRVGGLVNRTYTLLHLAVLSECTEMVDYILELLGKDAPQYCYIVNSDGDSPLSLAFALGLTQIVCYSELITEASKFSAESDEHASLLWKNKNIWKCGWFPHLMHLNTRAISAKNANIESTEAHQNDRTITAQVSNFQLLCINRLLRDAAKGRKNKIISRLLFLVEKFDLVPNILLDPEVLGLLVAGDYLSGVSFTLPQKSLQKVITRCGREDHLVNLLKLDFILHAGLMKQAFIYGCELNKSTVIHYFLQERDTHLLFDDSSVLKEGLALAIACGSYETASLILLEGGIHFEDKYLPPGTKLSEVIELIYTCTSYHQLLRKFYLSLTETNCNRIPISVAWLAHGWTEKEAGFIMKYLGGSTPSNPWIIHLQSQVHMGSQEISLSIDWESFSECLLHSPQVENETSKFRRTPLLVEATVFSPSVLGQICQACSTTQSFDIFTFPKAANLSSLILSSVVWPQEPSFSSLFEGQGILTLSFMPSERVFLFPVSPSATLSSGLDDSTMSFVSDMNVSSYTVEGHFLMNQLNDLAHIAVVTLKKEAKGPNSVRVSISFGDNIMDITDMDLATKTYAYVQMILSDITGVLNLVRMPNRVTSCCVHRNNSSMKMPCSSYSKLPFNEVKVLLDLCDRYLYFSETDAVKVLLTGSTLSVQLVLPRGSDLDSTHLSSYKDLPEVLISNIADAKIQHARRKLEKSISTVIVTNLKNHLRISGSLGSDYISLLYENVSGQKLKLDNVESICTSSYVKLRKFLLLFSKLFHILTYQPRLQASVRRLFDGGFKVILSDIHGTSFSLKMSVPCVTVNVHHILEGMPPELLMEIFKSLINSAQGQKHHVLDRSIPLPIMCYIDFENSSGLLYPVLNKTGVITVQLANHDSEIISSLPTVSCILKVCIITPDGSKITATSSQEPSPHAASRQLMANVKPNGQFIIEWTPSKAGLYRISIIINDCHVKGSPFKTHTLGSEETCQRQASAGEKITFVVSHSIPSSKKHTCSSVPPIVLYKRRNFKEVITKGDVITPLSSPSRNSSPSKLEHSLSAKGCDAVHHISMCSRYGGSRRWFHIPVGEVVVYISPQAGIQRQSSRTKARRRPSRSSFMVKHYAMNDGFTRLVISCRYAVVYKMFVACAKCQSVMDVLWLDQRSLLPSLLYVTPASFSGHYSKLMCIKSGTTSTARKQKILTTVTAGDRVGFSLKALDSYSNPHTTGGAIHKVSLKGAGQRDIAYLSSMFGERLQGALHRSRGVDVIWQISDEGNGTYKFNGCVFTAGVHDVVVNSIDHTSFTMGQIRVIHASPYAKHCCLELDSVYHAEPEVSKTYIILMRLYDEFFNACSSSRISLAGIQASIGQQQLHCTSYNKDQTKLKLSFTPYSPGQVRLVVAVRGELLRECPLTLTVKAITESFLRRSKALRRYLTEYRCYCYTPTLTIDRNNLLESAISVLNVENYFKRIVRVRFGSEPGIDTGGIAREFFHLLILECLNPQYALFECVNGLYKPNPNSYINSNHSFYFKFFGKVLARCIYDLLNTGNRFTPGHLSPVRFTPSFYKSLLGVQCSLEDLKIEDPSLYMSLVNIIKSESEEELELLALSFTASQSHFGSVKTVELDQGGKNKAVTLENKQEFVQKLYFWYLTGCIQAQLDCISVGFNSIIPPNQISNFLPHELEMILCGQPKVNVSFIKRRTLLFGYSRDSSVVKWLWEILESYSQEKLGQFLQFTTGSTSLPSSYSREWEFRIQQGSDDPSALPQVATCFNTIILPHYPSKKTLKEKLHTALEYGSLSFGRH